MRKWYNYKARQLKEKLCVFDFDDTLVKTDCVVNVTYPNGREENISTSDFKLHNKNSRNEYDFSDFENVVNPREITQVTSLLRESCDAGTDEKVVILTARQNAARMAIITYLEDLGFDMTNTIELVTLDDSDSQAKADWIEKKILRGHKDILFLDDSRANVDCVRRLQEKYPQIKLDARKVSYAEEIF